jgi:hypothetical protein
MEKARGKSEVDVNKTLAIEAEGKPKPDASHGWIWLRGQDLNLRPLGYEFDLRFAWIHAVPYISMPYSCLLALGSSCSGLLFLGSGNALGSKASTNLRR